MMILLFFLFFQLAFADDNSKEKKIFLLERALKNEDYNQAMQMIEKLLAEDPTNIEYWKLKFELSQNSNANLEELYKDLEKYLENGGNKEEIWDKKGELENELLSARFVISTQAGPISDWSKIKVSLDSNRFIQEEDGIYLLKFSEPREYTLSVTSSDPSIESIQKKISGTGFHLHRVVLKNFQPTNLTIPPHSEDMQVQVFPANNRIQSISQFAKNVDVGAGTAKVMAYFDEKSIEYETQIPTGGAKLELPWIFSINYEGESLHKEIVPPSQMEATTDGYYINSPFEGAEEILVSFALEQKQGEHQSLTISKESFEKTNLFKMIQRKNRLTMIHQLFIDYRMQIYIASGIGIIFSSMLQSSALNYAQQANEINSKYMYDEFIDLSAAAYGNQRKSIWLGMLGILSLSGELYFDQSPFYPKHLNRIQNRIDNEKNIPIVITTE